MGRMTEEEMGFWGWCRVEGRISWGYCNELLFARGEG